MGVTMKRKPKPSARAKNKTEPDKPRNEARPKDVTTEDFPVVGIGASAGGFEAFTELLKSLPERTGMALVLIQHLDPTHSSALTEILSRTTKIPVVEVTDGLKLSPDRVHVIPANSTMVIHDGELHLGARTLIKGQHLPIDQFFASLAKAHGNKAIGVVLSGTASDGTEGCRAIKAGGGITFAQDQQSAKFSSMPRSAISAGCVDFVLPPREIARELVRIARHPYVRERLADEKTHNFGEGDQLNQLLDLVRDASGVDFGLYKQTTLQRRIKRRMVVHRIGTVKEYLRYVHGNPVELDELYRDILIHVTGFFRDKEAYEALTERVFPTLLQTRKPDDNPIRIWVPGCSTGEEVYSIAICLLEFLWEKARTAGPAAITTKAVQIFATDISESALDRARTGLYTDAAVAEITPERLSRFFIRLDGGYQINKSIREMCVFARQNLTKDPPFSNLDLITCRNLLIYLGPELQKRVIPTLHYALKPDGFLMLGGSESLGPFSDHFLLVDKKNKIYQKKRSAARLITYFTGSDYAIRKPDLAKASATHVDSLSVDKEVERVLVNRFVPASIVVNDQMEIIQFRGKTGAYLEPAPGHPTFSLSKMAREGLLVDLRAAINKSKKTSSVVRADRVRVKSNGHTKEVDLEVIPVRGQGPNERFYIVVFQERQNASERPEKAKASKALLDRSRVGHENEQLKREAHQLREQLQSLIEDHETTSEEFKSANEEVLSANEELQSTNEELETAKEELQSSNEELTTLNEELQNRNTELSLANNDLMNLLGNVNIPVVMVGNDLRIRRFTPPAQKLLNLIPADIGRRLREIRPNLDVDDIENSVHSTIETATVQEREVHENGGAWYLMRVRPYKTWDSKIDGAVISFQDIDDIKRQVNESRNYVDVLVQNAREPILILDAQMNVSIFNQAFANTFQIPADQATGGSVVDLAGGRWAPPQLKRVLEGVIRSGNRVDNLELSHTFPELGERTVVLNARRFEPNLGQQMVYLAIEDITEKKKHSQDLQTHSTLLELANDAICVRDFEGTIQLWNRGAERIYQWTKEEAIGKPIYKFLKTKFPIPLKEVERELLKTGYWRGELIHTRKDGQHRIVESRWSLDAASTPPTIIELNTDITVRRSSEEQLRILSAQLMQAQDEERRRIARDLHDSTGQKLVAIKMGLSAKDGAGPEIGLVDEVLQEIRTLAQLLHPPLLEEAGLISAAQWLADGFAERAGIKVRMKGAKDLSRLSPEIEIAIFRVLQEALNNIHRHSGAKTAEIEIIRSADAISLTVKDDGQGMLLAPSGKAPSMGVGLLGMRERLAQFNGNLNIQSSSKGTVIEARVPIEQK
jgi:two-component system, chemotaxis family, CheB/CheR fusion protein